MLPGRLFINRREFADILDHDDCTYTLAGDLSKAEIAARAFAAGRRVGGLVSPLGEVFNAE